LLFDVSGAWSFTSIAMGVDPSTSLTELCRLVQGTDQDAFKRLIQPINEKLSILPTGLEKLLDDSVSEDQFEILLNHLMSIYPIIIIDVSASPSHLKRLVLNRAHEIVIVSNPTTSSLRTARSLINEIKDLHGSQDDNIDLIITMTDMAKESEVYKADIETVIDKKPFGYLPFIPKAYLNAEQGGKRRLNDPALQDMITLLTKFCALALKQAPTILDTNSQKTKNIFGNFLSSLTSK
jgi:pilus assembly protein CpaE